MKLRRIKLATAIAVLATMALSTVASASVSVALHNITTLGMRW